METGSSIRWRLAPADEYPHAVEGAENFNESVYANVFDGLRGSMGAWFRVGNRPNEGYAEVSCCIYLPDSSVGFSYARPKISGNDAFAAGGMKFEVTEPFNTMRVSYDGRVCLLKNPLEMADPKRAFRGNPMVPCRVALQYRGISPTYGGERINADGTPLEELPDEAFARAHYEQHVACRGTLRVADREWQVDGYGLRDHSWGPRYWQNIHWYRWLPMTFGPDFGMTISVVALASGRVEIGGMVLTDGTYHRVEDARVTARYDGNQYQEEIHAWARTAARGYEVEGRVLSLIPLRNRRRTPDGRLLETRITEAMTEYRCEGWAGYGMSEFLDQIEDGRPVGVK